MKKIIIIPIIIVVITAVAFIELWPVESKDNKKFNNEYGESVPKDTSIIYLNDNTIIKAFDTEDKLVFLGNPSSKDTQNSVKTLLKTAENNGIDKIYYYNVKNIEQKNIKNELITKMNEKEVTSPTLFLIKDKKIADKQIGLDDDLETKYEDIMIGYIMCNNPDC